MTPDSCISPLRTKVTNSYLFLFKHRFFSQPKKKKKDPEYSDSSFISLEAVPHSYLRGYGPQ